MSDSLEFNVDLSNYSGSLEILLDLAKSQKVDLENIKGSGKDGRLLKGDLITLMSTNPPPSDRKVKFGHDISYTLPNNILLVGCYHPSPRNVNTKLVTTPMINQLLIKAKKIAKF